MDALDPGTYRDVVRRALAEDLGWGDVTASALVGPDARAAGVLSLRTGGVLAGLDAALEAFRQLDPSISAEVRRRDGASCAAGEQVARLVGLASALLTAEQTALNLLGHLSGIATLTRRLVAASSGRVEIGDSRRTLPLLRTLEKYAVRVGGGTNGRFTLDEGVVIAANHARLAGGVAEAVALARAARPDVPVEVEVRSILDVDHALAAGASVLLLHQPAGDFLRAARQASLGRARIEVAGHYAPDTLKEVAEAGADRVSVSGLIDSAPTVDVTLDVERQ